MNSIPILRKRAVVTGASAGLGAAYAERLARDGYDLVLVARRRERLENLARRLTAEFDASATVLVADLADRDGLRTAERFVTDLGPFDLVINNAGYGGYAPFVELDPDAAEHMINLSITAVTRLTRAALPAMLTRGRGAIINVSSLLAFSASRPGSDPGPKRTMYAATKAYITAFSELLAHELEGTAVQVQAFCPGIVDTEFHTAMGTQPPPIPRMAADVAVDASLAGLALGEVICAPAVDDPEIIAEWQRASLRIANFARTNTLASRYQGTRDE